MKDLKVTYRRWGLRRTLRAQLPERWGELSAAQMATVAALHVAGCELVPLIASLCQIKESIVQRMDTYQLYVLAEQIDWARNADQPHNSFVIEQLPGTDLHAPGERLKGCSLQQFMTADTYFQLFAIHPDGEEYLNQFVAALYLRHGEYFNPDECQVPSERKRAAKVDMWRNISTVATVEKNYRMAVYLNFLLIHAWLSKAYPLLFPRSEEQEGKWISNVKPTDWLMVFDAFVGDNVAEMRQYQMMPATDAFRVMNRRIKNNMNKKTTIR